ncbi:hypothetical protein Bca4012_065571 [Brassica carinata]
MNLRFMAADTLQKLIILTLLTIWANFTRSGSLEWSITIFSLSTLPNTLVMGIPLLTAMYGEYSGSLMVQVVVLQCIIWHTVLLFLFEYRGAKTMIMEQFPETAASIVSFKVHTDVISLDGNDLLETDAEIGGDGKLHVTVRKSNASRRSLCSSSMTPRPSNITGAEIYSLNTTPRGSNFNHSDFYSVMGFSGGRLSDFGQSSGRQTPRLSNFEVSCGMDLSRLGYDPGTSGSYPGNPEFPSSAASKTVSKNYHTRGMSKSHNSKELHTTIADSRANEQAGGSDQGAKEIRRIVIDPPENGETIDFGGEEEPERVKEVATGRHKLRCNSTGELNPREMETGQVNCMPPASVMTRFVLTMVWRKLIRNPNTYSSLIGLIWALVAFR